MGVQSLNNQTIGLGLKRTLMGPLDDHPEAPVDFLEVAPENWIGIGGKMGKRLRSFTERYPFVCHGLTLSLGGPSPLNTDFLKKTRAFLDTHDIKLYSEHLSYCTDDAQLYDLLPIPFTEEAAYYVAGRIRQVQDILGRQIAIENVSYYAAPGKEIEEIEFINTVIEEADCLLHLDVNNIYVNSINHDYDAEAFLYAMPGNRIAYIHVAGHLQQSENLLIDTHGAPVIDPVWDLLDKTYERFGLHPTLLERDNNIPPFNEIVDELNTIASIQQKWAGTEDVSKAVSNH